MIFGIFGYDLEGNEFEVPQTTSRHALQHVCVSLQLPRYCHRPGVLLPTARHGCDIHHCWSYSVGGRDPRRYL